MSENRVSKLDRQKLQIEQAQFVFSLDPHTLLSLDLAAGALGRAVSTLRCDVTRRPSSLPRLTRLGGRVFVRVEDLLAYICPSAVEPHPKRRVGRRSNAEKVAGGAHG